MIHEVVEQMVRDANPVPDAAVFEPIAIDALLERDTRRTEMQTLEAKENRREAREAPKASTWNWKIPAAIGALAIAVVIGIVAMPGAEETASADPITRAEEVVNAWGTWDLTLLDTLPETTFVDYEFWDNVDRSTLGDEMLYREAVDWPFEVSECSLVDASAEFEGESVVCSVTHDPSWTRAQGLGPYPGQVRVTFVDGSITEFLITHDVTYAPEHFFPLRTWLSINYPDDMSKLYPLSRNYTAIDAEARELWGRYTTEYIDQLDE